MTQSRTIEPAHRAAGAARTDAAAVQAAVQEFNAGKASGPSRHSVAIAHGFAMLLAFPGALYLANMHVSQSHRGKGHASAALAEICAIADRHHVLVKCCVEPFGFAGVPPGLSRRALRAWYQRHGFRPDPSTGMLARMPVPVPQAAEQPEENDLSTPNPSQARNLAPEQIPFAAGDIIVFCDDFFLVDANYGDHGEVRYLDGSSPQSHFRWVFEQERCRRAVPADFAPYVERGAAWAIDALARVRATHIH